MFLVWGAFSNLIIQNSPGKALKNIPLFPGININGESFSKKYPDSYLSMNMQGISLVHLYRTTGSFSKNSLHKQVCVLIIMTSLRLVLLPRLSLLYKINHLFTSPGWAADSVLLPYLNLGLDEREFQVLLASRLHRFGKIGWYQLGYQL